MRAVVTILWFLTAFVAGATLYAVNRPNPLLHAVVTELKGGNLFTRCQKAGACGKPAESTPRGPVPRLPANLDRA